MKKRIPPILTFLLLNLFAFGQHQADSTFVTFHPYPFDSISLTSPKPIDTSTFHANQFDPVQQPNALYSTLSNIGTAHKTMRFPLNPNLGFDMSLPSFSQLIKTENDLKTYLSLLPYSEARYVMTTGDKEQHLYVHFGRQVYQGLYLSFEYHTNYSPGIFANSQTDNNYFWINLLYTTNDQRYRAQAYWFRNKLEMQENGGIVYDSVYYNQVESDNSVILTNLNNCSNYIKVSGAGFQQYFNLLPQYKKEKLQEEPREPSPEIHSDSLEIPLDSLTITEDSLEFITDSLGIALDSLEITLDSLEITLDSLEITLDSLVKPADSIVKPIAKQRKFTLGRINHHFAYQRNQLFYNETSATLPFYAPYDTLLSAKTTDTLQVYAFRNGLQWNTLGYQQYSDNVPFYLFAGIDYDFYRLKHYDYLEKETIADSSYSQVILSGGLIINLLRSTNITAKAQIVTLGYQIGDFSLQGRWRQYLGNTERNFGKLVFDFTMKRQSPTWFESRYYSNHFRWENDFHAATYLDFDLHYHYKSLCVGVKQTSVNDLIYFDAAAHPAQHDGFISVRELYGNFKFNLWRFQFEGFCGLQKASNEDVIHLPLFLGKVKIGFQQPIFKKAAILQPSITVQYFTKYYADAYMPALRTFYQQNEVLIGNYPFLDAALAINVKQADIYVQYSNMFLLTGDHHSFIAPHYPMRDSKIFLGINWRLFN